MTKYMRISGEAAELAVTIQELTGNNPVVAQHLVRLFNLGIRVSPRGVQSTVRIRACTEMAKHLPVRVGKAEKQGDRGPYTILTTEIVK